MNLALGLSGRDLNCSPSLSVCMNLAVRLGLSGQDSGAAPTVR